MDSAPVYALLSSHARGLLELVSVSVTTPAETRAPYWGAALTLSDLISLDRRLMMRKPITVQLSEKEFATLMI